MSAADKIQELTERLARPGAKEGVEIVIEFLKLRREKYRLDWEAGTDSPEFLRGRSRETKDLLKILGYTES